MERERYHMLPREVRAAIAARKPKPKPGGHDPERYHMLPREVRKAIKRYLNF